MDKHKLNRRELIANSLKFMGAMALAGNLPELIEPARAADDLLVESFRPESKELVQLLENYLSNQTFFAEIYLEQSVSRQFDFTNGKLVDSRFSKKDGLTIRGVNRFKTAFATTDSFSREAAREAAKKVRKELRGGDDELVFKNVPRYPLMDFGAIVSRKKLESVTRADVRAILESIIRQAPPASNLIKETIFKYKDVFRRILVLNSDGVFIADQQPTIDIHLACTAEVKGRSQHASANTGHRCGMDILTNESLLINMNSVSARAVELLSTNPISSGEYQVMLSPQAAASLVHSWYLFENPGATTGQAKARGPVPRHMTLVDNGRIVNARGTSHFDDEGTFTSRTYIVRDGLRTNQLNQRFAPGSKDSPLTGNARRASFDRLPEVAPTNLYFESTLGPSDLGRADLENGLYISEMIPHGQASHHGQFQYLVKSGWLVKNGGDEHPVQNLLINVRFPDILHRIDAAGLEPEFYPAYFGPNRIPGSCGGSHLSISKLSVRQL